MHGLIFKSFSLSYSTDTHPLAFWESKSQKLKTVIVLLVQFVVFLHIIHYYSESVSIESCIIKFFKPHDW